MEDTITFIEGPPGSGKTSVIEEIILQKLERQEDCPILCVAESNIAIDNICQRLLIDHSDINMVRAVSIVREQEYPIWHELGPFCLHNLVQRELSAELWAIKKKIEANGPNSVSASDYLNLRKVQGSSINRIVANADIVFATSVQAGRVFAQTGREFGTVIMDESTQAPECSSMIPVSLPGVKRIVLVGDKEQLSSTDIIRRLPNSFFKRALEAKASLQSFYLSRHTVSDASANCRVSITSVLPWNAEKWHFASYQKLARGISSTNIAKCQFEYWRNFCTAIRTVPWLFLQ